MQHNTMPQAKKEEDGMEMQRWPKKERQENSDGEQTDRGNDGFANPGKPRPRRAQRGKRGSNNEENGQPGRDKKTGRPTLAKTKNEQSGTSRYSELRLYCFVINVVVNVGCCRETAYPSRSSKEICRR